MANLLAAAWEKLRRAAPLDFVSQAADCVVAATVVWFTRTWWAWIGVRVPLIGDTFAAGYFAALVGMVSVCVAFHAVRLGWGAPRLGAMFTIATPLWKAALELLRRAL